jgi:hypothetical protein
VCGRVAPKEHIFVSDSQESSEPESPQLRPPDLAAVRAVVVDANIMGKRGDLRISVLRRLNDISTRDGYLEVLVPEPVLWEWQEHAARGYIEAARSLTTSASQLAEAGLELPVLQLSADDVRTQVLDAVKGFSRVRIVALSPEHALDALRDQILALPPAERVVAGNNAIKTGASDSAWIRAVHAEAAGESSTYIVLSNDNDVAIAYQHWGWEAPLQLPSVNAFSKLIEGVSFPELTPDRVSAAVKCLLNETWEVVAFDLVDEGGVVRGALGEETGFLEVQLLLDSIASVAGFADLSVVDRVGTIQGTLYLIGAVDVTGWQHNSVTDKLDAGYAGRFQCLLRTPILITPADDWPGGLMVTFEDSSAVHPITGEWATAEDALEGMLEAVGTLPGCEGLSLPDDYESGSVLAYECSSPLPIEMRVDHDNPWDDWTATVSHAGVSLAMSCLLAESTYFGEIWILRGEVSFAEGSSTRVEDVWSGVSYLLASFVETTEGDQRVGSNS